MTEPTGTGAREVSAPAALSETGSRRARVAVAIEICCARPTLRRTIRIAAVVGLVLTAINEGDGLVRGAISVAIGIKIVFNFLVPFVVSNLGVLAGTGRAGSQPPSVAKPPTIVP
jgi:hypothetical protein